MRASRAIRATAWTIVAVGVAAPLLRRRLGLRPAMVLSTAAAAPFALCVAQKRSGKRDVAVCVLQMWAYLAGYEMPNDDHPALERRVHVRYPAVIDRALGLGVVPSLRLQRRWAAEGSVRPIERVLVWAHWMWFCVPHGTLAYVKIRQPERFPAAAARMYAVFDLGLIAYWAAPTAPPWYAAQRGMLVEAEDGPILRRIMTEYGELFWRDGWRSLYSVLAGNPLAAMPSLHFATSVMAAHLLAEQNARAGALGWGYAGTLGLALVYLGEHYVIDLIAGLALAQGVRHVLPRFTPAAQSLGSGLRSLEALAAAR